MKFVVNFIFDKLHRRFVLSLFHKIKFTVLRRKFFLMIRKIAS